MNNKEIIKEAIREYRKEEQNKAKKNIEHNTKLLMKNYNSFQQFVDNAITSAKDLDINIEGLEPDELYIYSIKKSKTRTILMLAQIDVALDLLKRKQKRLKTMIKYKAFKRFYIDEKTIRDIAEELHCSELTIRRYINEMTQNLGIYLFGADGLIKS